MDPALVTSLTPFGAAGLIAWLWLSERRSGAERERQLTEAHAHLSRQRIELSLLVDVVRENTRALTALEAALRMPSGMPSGIPGGVPGGEWAREGRPLGAEASGVRRGPHMPHSQGADPR